MKQFTCDWCGKTFQDFPSQRKTTKIFCNHKCKTSWNKTLIPHNKGKKAPQWVKDKLKLSHPRLTGPAHGRWKGGRRIDKDGYILIWQPSHPNSDYHGYVREHRLVYEEFLGRYLLPIEVIHHKDLNKQNNHIKNLELYNDNSSHQKEHYRSGTGAAPYLNNHPRQGAKYGRLLFSIL